MKRGWKILIGVLVALAVLLAVNTLVVDGETKDAEVTVDGGQIISLPGGDVQVTDSGAPGRAAPGRADRAHPLLRLLAALVGRAGAAARRATTA